MHNQSPLRWCNWSWNGTTAAKIENRIFCICDCYLHEQQTTFDYVATYQNYWCHLRTILVASIYQVTADVSSDTSWENEINYSFAFGLNKVTVADTKTNPRLRREEWQKTKNQYQNNPKAIVFDISFFILFFFRNFLVIKGDKICS